jgi:phage baseplate assembly protein gpV
MFTPDVGDLVLVLCPHADPARGIVLGGLYGMDAHPDPGVEDGAVKRFTLRTPGGQVLKLDDTGQIIRFDNSDGSFVELAPGTVKLHSNVDLEIEAPGQAVVIRGSTIDFQQG